jgi:hypothetical protein
MKKHNMGLKLPVSENIFYYTVTLAARRRLGVPYFPQQYLEKLIEDDSQCRAFRPSVNPDLPDMGFVGFNPSLCTVLFAEMMRKWKRNEHPAAKTYGGLCSAPFHFKHFDGRLSDMGATKTKRGVFSEQFKYPDHKAYGDFLASTPQYQAG